MKTFEQIFEEVLGEESQSDTQEIATACMKIVQDRTVDLYTKFEIIKDTKLWEMAARSVLACDKKDVTFQLALLEQANNIGNSEIPNGVNVYTEFENYSLESLWKHITEKFFILVYLYNLLRETKGEAKELGDVSLLKI